MGRPPIENGNPIRSVRLRERQSLEEFASRCHVHLQAVYLNEMGMYPTILPSIMRHLVKYHGYDPVYLEDDYQDFIKETRTKFSEEHAPYTLPYHSLAINPLHRFRLGLEFTTAFGFAKAICLNPTIIRRVEKCTVDVFPKQLRQALEDISLPVGDIEELQYRHQEYFHCGLKPRRGTSGSNYRVTN